MKITQFRTGVCAATVILLLGGESAPAATSAPTAGTAYTNELVSLGRETDRLDTWLIRIGVLQAVIFLAQFIAFIVQAIKLHQTVEAARKQAVDMSRSVEHAARGATAMETVAGALTSSTNITTELLNLQKEVFRKNLRAYLTVSLQAYLPENQAKIIATKCE
jgi:hypothetical protein